MRHSPAFSFENLYPLPKCRTTCLYLAFLPSPDAHFTLLQYNIQTSYSLSFDAILHAGAQGRCQHAGANVQKITRSQQCGFHMVRAVLRERLSGDGASARQKPISPSRDLFLWYASEVLSRAVRNPLRGSRGEGVSVCGRRVLLHGQRGWMLGVLDNLDSAGLPLHLRQLRT